MYAFAVTVLIYLNHAVPWVLSRPLLYIPISVLIILSIIQKSIDRALEFLFIVLLIIVLSSASSAAIVSSGIAEGEAYALYGRVSQDSVQRKGRSVGFRIEADAVEDRHGSVFTARGSVYVIADQTELYRGDFVRCSGRFSGPVFISSGSAILSRPLLTSFRRSLVMDLKERLGSAGEAGELSMRLLLGSGELGVYGLSDDARSAGLAHVLALSGMHLTIIAAFLSIPLSFLGKDKRRFIITPFLIFFSFLSGWRPSLLRALIFRMLLERKLALDEAFIASAVMLFTIQPSSSVDIGAEYSFISLAAIFLLSGRIDRGLRSLLPLPPAFSLSVSASAAALIFSIPLTLSVFGCYQLGAIVTSLPLTAMISLYMGLSIAVLAFPPLSPLLELAYRAVRWAFGISAVFPDIVSPVPYLALLSVTLLLIIIARNE